MSFPVNSENKVKFITTDSRASEKPAATGLLKLKAQPKAGIAVVKKKTTGDKGLVEMKSLNIIPQAKDPLVVRPLKLERLPLGELPTVNIGGVVTIKNPLADRSVKKIDKDFYNMLVNIIKNGTDSLDMPRVYLDMPEAGKEPAARVRMNRHMEHHS